MTIHKDYDGRKVHIANPHPDWINPFAGKVGDVKYAGWDDWYLIYVDGIYMVRVQAHEIEHMLVEE